jgi:hypothetical protein
VYFEREERDDVLGVMWSELLADLQRRDTAAHVAANVTNVTLTI